MTGQEVRLQQEALEDVTRYIQDTQRWLERAVIGLNLCPFAKAVYVKNQIHYAVSDAKNLPELRAQLAQQLVDLAAIPAHLRDTTLWIVPQLLSDFLDFNDFLAQADDVLMEQGLEGMLQIASFHPDYQFAGTQADDITNFTNRSPYPTLHLIREASMDKAVEAFPQPETIFEANMQTLIQLGIQGWQALDVGPSAVGPRETANGPGTEQPIVQQNRGKSL